jgi:2,3,4,5-tetrahydropyridine-2-carboxylate N-succinyltransferase
MHTETIKENIKKYFTDNIPKDAVITDVLNHFLEELNVGTIRASDNLNDKWITNIWVKQGILLLFRYGNLEMISSGCFTYFEKNTLGLKKMSLSDGVRIVMGGSAIRNGCYIAKGVICMPPSYINIGAYIDDGSMIDSHTLVGTCAQIGKNVHISAAAQIGGVLEPIGANPVIIEDNVMIGGNCGLYEGVIVKKNAILGSGVILNSSVKVYDLVNESVLNNPLVIPENAVVVQGTRGINTDFGIENKLSISTALIVKYRDNKTNSKTKLENILR